MSWHWAWAIFALVGVSMETVALVRTQRGDTASEWVWAWLKVTPGHTPLSAALVRFPTYVVGALLVWLLFHFTLGWWA